MNPTAYQIFLSNGKSYVSSLSPNISFAEAIAYFSSVIFECGAGVDRVEIAE